MLLTIDIGNTNINIGIFAGGKLKRRMRFAASGSGASYSRAIKRGFRSVVPEAIVICSVVPATTIIVSRALRRLFPGARIFIAGRDIRVPIKNLYKNPAQVGQDRLVGAYAASEIYGAPVIIVDFGTAVTIDAVSKSGSYLGGAIAPGIEISLSALHKMTALLPEVKPSKPKALIGRDTKESILSGVIFGLSGMTDTLIKKIKQRSGSACRVIGTGGGIGLVSPHTSVIDIVDKDLVLKGLRLIYCKNHKKTLTKPL
ncbi:MAG: type III pantothenate kinase [Candidatus Omnitrophica bacterium]|nr:type III pantothenate kinase [Candidatus Omnitrophota bacterium]